MNRFILPVTIESRKILFLDLEYRRNAINQEEQVGEDVFIVELPTMQKRTMLTISCSKLIQSLHDEIDDLQIKDLSFSFKYEDSTRTLQINITDEISASDNFSDDELELGLFLKSEKNGNEINLHLTKSPDFNGMESDFFYVNFILKLKNDKLSYSALIKFHYTEKEFIRFTGLDFGSEASQICEGNYTDNNTATIETRPIDLFAAIKERSKYKDEKNDDFMQYEDRTLYKSVFYVRNHISVADFDPAPQKLKLNIPSEAIDVMTLKGDSKPEFFENWLQIPNLKLVHNNSTVNNKYNFTIASNGHSYHKNLGHLRDSIYAGLLKELLISYLKRSIHSPVYLRFTLLVPNIYTIDEIYETKRIIREIIRAKENDVSQYIKGLEISSLSESDAAFLGCLNFLPVKGGNYFIIIDCGKGTTDFSIIQSERNNHSVFKPVYRNGFAGAGNLISFAVMQSALEYIKMYNEEDSATIVNYQNFLKYYLTEGPSNNTKNKIFELAEKWKKNYDTKLDRELVEAIWSEKSSGKISFKNLFERDRPENEILSFFKEVDYVHDWGGYIATSVHEIVTKIHDSLAPVIRHMNKTAKCGGILFTGRGFLFKPLEEAVKTRLQNIKGLAGVHFIDDAQIDLKKVCLQGVFARNIMCYNDIATTPIEIKKGELKQFTKADIKREGLFSFIGAFIDKLLNFDGEYFDEDSNSCKVLNLDFNNTQFLIGGKVYQPAWSGQAKLQSAQIIHSRRGFFIRAKDEEEKVHILQVFRASSLNSQSKEQEIVAKSLFPGWFEPQLLQN